MRRVVTVLLGGLNAGTLVVGAASVLLHDQASPFTVGQALHRFRAQEQRAAVPAARPRTRVAAARAVRPHHGGHPTSGVRPPAPGTRSTAAAPAGRRPPPVGVYVYATSGSETASPPGFPASTHTYPDRTTVTVTTAGCGQSRRWQPLADRWEEQSVCLTSTGAERLLERTDHEQFYGHTDQRTLSCAPGSLDLPAGETVGATFGGSCTNGGNTQSGGFTMAYRGQVAGVGTLLVGGVAVRAIHLVVDETFTGATTGSGRDDRWVAAATGLLLQEDRTEQTQSQSAVGAVPSSEHVTLRLLSVRPQT